MNDFSEKLIEDYIDADPIIDQVVDLIIWNNGELDYSFVKELCAKTSLTDTDFAYILFGCAITKHIPLFKNKQRIERPSDTCLRGFQVFNYTRVDEDDFLAYSKKDTRIPEFKRHDQKDNGKFHAGVGSKLADFEAVSNPNIIVDMKATNDKEKAASSTHDANFILCPKLNGSAQYAFYKLTAEHDLDETSEISTNFISVYRDYPLIRFIPKKYLPLVSNIDQTLKDIDEGLKLQGFKWPD